MGFGEKIKSVYYFFEDKWYHALDKINNYLPVYKVVDQVDKVIPSFIVFLLILLFLIISMGYFVRFTSPYDITFTTYDSESKAFLSGVNLNIELNGEKLSKVTNSKGIALVASQGNSKNTFDILTQMFFSISDSPVALVSAKKEGYVDINKTEIDLKNTSQKIFLQKISPEVPNSNSTLIELYDSSNSQKLIDSENRGEVKFNCANKTIPTRTVRDNSDGLIDGIFKLDEENCEFVFKYAAFPGYEPLSISSTLPRGVESHRVELIKIAAPTTGSAKVFVFDNNSFPKQYLPGINVALTLNETRTSRTNASGVAELNNLSPGKYVITISDSNYYEITPDHNISITIIASNVPREIEIGLEKVSENDARQIFFKVFDTNNSIISNAKVDLLWIREDSNGNFFAANNDNPAVYKSGPSHTDSNGLFKINDVTIRTDGNLMAIVKKDGFLPAMFKPVFFKTGEGPETVVLEKADSTNSGRAKLVVSSTNNKLLYNAETTIFRSFLINNKLFNNFPVEKKVTNLSGEAAYSALPAGMGNEYSASAIFDNVSSGLTQKYPLSPDQNIIIPVTINLDVSYLSIRLFDFSKKELIQNPQNAEVKLYLTNNNFENKQLAEEIQYSLGKFVSRGYANNSYIQVNVDLEGYVIENLFIDGVSNRLSQGENQYDLYLISKDSIENDIEVFYENIYKNTDNPWSGISTVETVDSNKEYYIKFRAITASDINYQEIFSMARVSSNAKILNIFSLPPAVEQDAFSCTTTALDSQANDENYYFPTTSNCSSGEQKLQAGFKWDKNSITNNFLIKIKVGDAEDNEKLTINYRAKEKSENNSFETELKSIDYYIGQPIFNGIFFKTKINSLDIAFTNNVSQKVNLIPNTRNPLSFKIINNLPEPMTNLSITAYSHLGSRASFNEASQGTGTIKFDSADGSSRISLTSNTSIGSLSERAFSVDLHTTQFNSQTYIVLVISYGADKNILFIDTSARGLELLLDAEFLGGVTNQLFEGTVNPSIGTDNPIIINTNLKVYSDCGTTIKTLKQEYTLSQSEINLNTFGKIIEGTYRSGLDCLELTLEATGNNYSYDVLNKIIYARGSSIDPSLACIDVRTSQGEAENVFLDWGLIENIDVINNCSETVRVKIETGLFCTNCITEYSIQPGLFQRFVVTGKNITYNPEIKNSDILGYFPFIVKARLENAPRKRYTIADEIGIHLSNPEKCFFISKDLFNFNDADSIDFIINNKCQYTEIGDYFIPKASLEAFGVSLEDNKPKYDAVTFDWSLVATGDTYTVEYTSEEKEYWASSFNIPLTTENQIIIDDDSAIYQISLDMSIIDNNVTELFYKWNDMPNPNFYGADINGLITITYTDGTIENKNPVIGFELGSNANCVCNGLVFENSCGVNGRNYCLIGSEDNLPEIDYGIIHLGMNNKQIQRMDFNLVGNSDLTNLSVRIMPRIKVIELTPHLVVTDGTVTQTFNSGEFTIYPVEGATYILRNVGQDSGIGLNLEESYCKESRGKKAWLSNNTIFWVDPYYTNHSSAVNVCAQTNGYTNMFGQNGVLATYSNDLLALINSKSSDFYWMADGNYGLWTNSCAGDNCDVLVKGDPFTKGIADRSENSPETKLLAPLCQITVPQNFSFDEEACISNSTCAPGDPPICYMDTTSNENNFFVSGYLSLINPRVKFVVENVRADGTLLNNNSLVMWIEGKYLKARFLGEDYVPHNNGLIELTLNNDFSNSTQYGIISIRDYINKGRLKN